MSEVRPEVGSAFALTCFWVCTPSYRSRFGARRSGVDGLRNDNLAVDHLAGLAVDHDVRREVEVVSGRDEVGDVGVEEGALEEVGDELVVTVVQDQERAVGLVEVLHELSLLFDRHRLDVPDDLDVLGVELIALQEVDEVRVDLRVALLGGARNDGLEVELRANDQLADDLVAFGVLNVDGTTLGQVLERQGEREEQEAHHAAEDLARVLLGQRTGVGADLVGQLAGSHLSVAHEARLDVVDVAANAGVLWDAHFDFLSFRAVLDSILVYNPNVDYMNCRKATRPTTDF